MFTILIRSLFGSMILVCKLYSLPDDVSIFNGLRTYVAKPPRVLSGRRCSTTVNPSIIGGAAPSDIQVSYKHNISTCSCSRRRRSLI
jgi:hypothetical protein